MRTLLAFIAAVVIGLPFVMGAQEAQQPGTTGGNPQGALGPVDALGQAIRRPPPPTGPPPRLPDGTIDLGDGLWIGGGPGDMAAGLPKGETLPLLPWAKALMADRATRPSDDPYYWCMPMGVPRVTPYPYRFVQNYTLKPTHMFILHEAIIHTFRQIFMDGRTHPAELEPSWFGHSLGRWEGDTFVIDTVGYNDKFWFDRKGTPHSEQLHTVERWTRLTKGTMVNAITIDDPGAYSRPFTVTYDARLAPPGDELMENFCQENNQFGIAGGLTHPFAGK